MPETTALGAAMAAGAAEGVSVWSLNPEDLSEVTSEKFEPQINPEGAVSCSCHALHTRQDESFVGGFFADENLNVFSPYVSGREWVSVRAMEESSSEIHELGDDGACL